MIFLRKSFVGMSQDESHCGLGATWKKALSARLPSSPKNLSTLYLQTPRRGHDWEGLWGLLIWTLSSNLRTWWAGLFMGKRPPLNQDRRSFHYYEFTCRWSCKEISNRCRRTGLVGKKWSREEEFRWTKQLFLSIFDGCLSFVWILVMRWFGRCGQESPRSLLPLARWLALSREELSRFLSHYRMNENVASVLQVNSPWLPKKSYHSRTSVRPLYQSSLFGQLIKRETNAMLTELLNKQRIKNITAYSSSYRPMTVANICYQLVTIMWAIFTRFSAKLCGNRLKPIALIAWQSRQKMSKRLRWFVSGLFDWRQCLLIIFLSEHITEGQRRMEG